MVMSAGAGTRLRPLTFAVPKPMVPIANKPVLEHTLDNLKRHGIREVILNLHSYPGMIQDYFGDGALRGMRLTYSLEPKLLGTAGGVKKAESFLKGETFLVMSGDGLTDIDLTRLVEFHRHRRAVATMAVKSVPAHFEYGVTLTDRRGRITRFVEKPAWGDVFSDEVNTGIYVFEPSIFRQIPRGRPYDFGQQLWPKLLRQRQRIFGYRMDNYWDDVGNLNEYRKAQQDALDGKVHIQFPGWQVRPGVWIDEGTRIEPHVKLEPPCLVGRGCRIERGSVIGPYTVIGHHARIGRRTHLRRSILWNDVQVRNGISLENCIIGHRAQVNESISVYEGAVMNIDI
jgi:mannose-1-phosphate guanylyltransferase/phosphomannomutase